METIKIRDQYIKLGQAMKLAGLAEEGSEAKQMILNGEVEVNGQTEIRRGKKLFDGYTINNKKKTVKVTK